MLRDAPLREGTITSGHARARGVLYEGGQVSDSKKSNKELLSQENRRRLCLTQEAMERRNPAAATCGAG